MGTYETKKMARSCLALILIATILARGTEGQPSTPPSSETQSAQTNSTDLTNSTLDQVCKFFTLSLSAWLCSFLSFVFYGR
jgi:hypothetical protein